MGSYTDILFARPSFAEGMARIMDFGNTLNEYNRTPDPDAIALSADWNAVAEDLYKVVEQVSGEQERVEAR
jgi:hypothetical protein